MSDAAAATVLVGSGRRARCPHAHHAAPVSPACPLLCSKRSLKGVEEAKAVALKLLSARSHSRKEVCVTLFVLRGA